MQMPTNKQLNAIIAINYNLGTKYLKENIEEILNEANQ